MSNNNENSISKNTFRASIITSIIASMIFLAFIQPIMIYFWEVISSTGNKYLNSIVDLMYENAALGDRNWVISILAIVGVYAPFILWSTRQFASWLAKKLSTFENLSEEDRKKKTNAILLKLRIFVWVNFFLGITAATFLASSIYIDMQINASFKQRLIVLTPKLSDTEYKQYLADWALMTSKNDYQIINQKLENQANELGVKLPSLLIKD